MELKQAIVLTIQKYKETKSQIKTNSKLDMVSNRCGLCEYAIRTLEDCGKCPVREWFGTDCTCVPMYSELSDLECMDLNEQQLKRAKGYCQEILDFLYKKLEELDG